MENNSNGYATCPECGGKMIQTVVADECLDCGYYYYYYGAPLKIEPTPIK